MPAASAPSVPAVPASCFFLDHFFLDLAFAIHYRQRRGQSFKDIKYYVMLCCVMFCYLILCYVVLCYVMLCYVVLCCVMLFVLCHVM